MADLEGQVALMTTFVSSNPHLFLRWTDYALPPTVRVFAKISRLPTVANGMTKIGMAHLYEWFDLERRAVLKQSALEAGYLSANQAPSLLLIPGLTSNPNVFHDIDFKKNTLDESIIGKP